ncbi:unnamed protein product, partial [Ilex paraguariensis]
MNMLFLFVFFCRSYEEWIGYTVSADREIVKVFQEVFFSSSGIDCAMSLANFLIGMMVVSLMVYE